MANLIKGLLIFCMLSFSGFCYAALPSWKMIPELSTLTFTGIQNNAPITGSFKRFTSVINFDPQQLKKSNVHIVVQMNSISLSFRDLITVLFSGDWLDVNKYPEAIFDAKNFTQLGPNHFQARGTLTIKDKKMPVNLTFATREMEGGKVLARGGTTIKRTAFGIGQGEWADTDAVKDDVKVDFMIIADKQ
ncbi:MAG: YceI family protein [Gammaproteobacteria bacterium]